MIALTQSIKTRRALIAGIVSFTLSACGAGTEDLPTTDNATIQAANPAASSEIDNTSSASDVNETDTIAQNQTTVDTTQTDSEASGNTQTTDSEIQNSTIETSDNNAASEPAPNTTSTEPETIDSDTSDSETQTDTDEQSEPDTDIAEAEPLQAIDSSELYDYESLIVPSYITKDNTTSNTISNAGATLGRVLFYDNALSSNDTVSCASCHQQAVGFSDTATVSQGVNGVTGRHSMRLVNTRFAEEANFFWDERAATLEEQTTQPIRDHGEMGFSGEDGAPDFNELISKLEQSNYYPTLFTMAFGNSVITEERMQDAMAQFLRSIQSFDSRFDIGRSQAPDNISNFVNFSTLENQGKQLFLRPPTFNTGTGERIAGSGLGCNGCHQAPEFDIDTNSRNNGVIGVAGNVLDTDLTNTRSPTLRDLFAPDGNENGPFMHDGSLATFSDVLDHYNTITHDPAINPTLDNRLRAGVGGSGPSNGPGQKLLLTDDERDALTAFMKTLGGTDVYVSPLWSDPFLPDGSLSLTP